MQIDVELNIQADDFFRVITDSVHQDVGSEVSVSVGLSYQKKLATTFGHIYTADVVITEYTPNELYAVKYETTKSTVLTTYKISKTQNGIVVSYEETEVFVKKMDHWNAKIMKVFYEKSRAKQLKAKLQNLENYIKGD